ncbi:MAG: rod shape-determining protein MreC [Chthoniobacterales bacterium]
MKKVNILLAVIVSLLAVYLMLLGTGSAQKVQGAVMSLLSPFQRTGSAMQQGIGAMGQGLKSLDQLRAENEELHRENDKLKATNQILSDMKTENDRLRDALGYREHSAFRLVPAQVITRDASAWWSSVTINRGFEDSVDDGSVGGMPMTVITNDGLVGKVMTAEKNAAKVMLITDENCKVGAYVEGTREKGIVSGVRVQEGGKPELQMNFLSRNANLQPGQVVYTQGVGAVFPPGLPIGRVKSFKSRELDGQAILEPVVDFSTLADVFVIVGVK